MPNEERKKLLNRLSPTEEQGRVAGGSKLIEATYIIEGCHRASETYKGAEPISRKERASLNY